MRKIMNAEIPARIAGTRLQTGVRNVVGGVAGVLLAVVLALTLTASEASAQAPTCPCTLFTAADAPFGDAVWDSPVEVGVRFRSDVSGYITGLRFYRQASNAGAREGHIWSAGGELLRTVQFPDGPTGWQEAQLAIPLAITANTTYVASYYASTGRFAFSGGAFNVAGIDRPPLHAPAAFDGGNGVYKYGSAPVFPTETWNGTNYWVDVTFSSSTPADTRPPGLASVSPASGGTGAPLNTKVEVTFDEPMDPLTINSGSITLADGPNAVAASVAYDAATKTATLTPTAPLTLGKTYTATVKSGNAGPADVAGNKVSADISWTFSTPKQCPCTVFQASDAPSSPNAVQDAPLELGMRFQSTEDGYITALRFYKQANNTGTHVGSLWSGSGQLLARTTFANETASGWQQVSLTNPVPVTKNATYVVSYYSPKGFFANDAGFFATGVSRAPMVGLSSAAAGGNGVYKYGAGAFPDETWNSTNYWVDASFDRTIPPDTTGPSVVTTTPGAQAKDQSRDVVVSAEFDESLSAASVDSTSFILRDAQGTAVPASVSYDAQTRSARLQPTAPLAFEQTYTATLKSGASGIKDASNNPLAADRTWTFSVEVKSPAEGPGGPILLATSASDPFGRYYAEILRAEGLNSFEAVNGPLTAAKLTGKTTVLLAAPTVTDAEVALLTTWVGNGGNLIALRPDKKLAGLLGLTDAGGTLANGYTKVDGTTAVGAGLEQSTLQFHGTSDRYTLNGATALATLYSDASTATSNPATTLRTVGAAGGQAAAFSYDLARSIVYTRQGNPAWVDDKRDNTAGWIATTRASDLFYGPKQGDLQPNWVDMAKIDVPQADEQQRLLANLITEMNLDKAPLPRFWYLPRGEKAAVVLTADDHGIGGVTPWLQRMDKMSPTGCSVADWECVRGTVYMYVDTPITDAQAAAFQAEGHELGLHVNTGCNSFTSNSFQTLLGNGLTTFATTWPSLDRPVSNRTHCVAWSGWVTAPKSERAQGIRFDTNYYYQGPEGWLSKPGLLTGGGFPQRFADLDGSMVDVYQAMTQVTDETEDYLGNPRQLHTLLDNALGPKAYYGVFTVLTHSDHGDHNNANRMVAEAQRRGVPVVTSKQMLDWTDGRNGSAFSDIAYSGNNLTFSVTVNPKANGLEAMLPARSASGSISKLRRNGQPVSWDRRTVKGQDYIVFKAVSGSYTATYATDTLAPDITAVSMTADNEGRATVSWTTDEPATSKVEYGRTSALGYELENTARVNDHSLVISGLAPGTTYYARVSSTDAAGNTGTTTPAPVAIPAGAVVDTRTSDFAAGTASNTYVGQTFNTTDGEVVQRPTVGEEFGAGTTPAGWITNPWDAGGFTTFSGGELYVDGSVASTSGMYSPGRSLDFVATFQPTNDQGVGFGNDFSDYPFAAFTTGNNGDALQLYAISGATFANVVPTALPSVTLSQPHRFRIEWNANNVIYSVDGQVVATHTISIPGPMRPLASDYRLFGAGVAVNWMRMGTYQSQGTFVSRVMDGGPGANQWQTLTPTAPTPTGTAIQWQTRTGATPTPDASWSPWVNLGAANAVTSPPGRYIQYQARLTRSSGSNTPTIQRVQISYSAGTDTPPVLGTVSISPAAPRTTQTVTATPAGFSDPDGDPLSYRYQWYRNGTAIAGATTNTLNLSLPGNGDLGDKIRVEVFVTDGRGAATDAAVATKTVANTAPTAGTAGVKPVPPSSNDTVTALPAGFADIDGDTLSYRYQWLRNGTPIAGATGKTLDLSLPGNGDLGDRIDVDISAIDPNGGISPTVRGGQNITGTNSTPVPGTVSITPAGAKTKDTVTANTTGFRDPDNQPITYAYQWKRNGTAIAGATAKTLDLSVAGNGDIGDVVSVDVTARDPQAATSDPASAEFTVANTAPVSGTVTVKPTVPATNDVVSASMTDYKDDDGDALSYQYQWYKNGAALSGQTGRSLDLSEAGNGDFGDTLMVRVTALDGRGGTSSTVQGSATVTATNSNPVASYGFEEAGGNLVVDETGGNDGDLGGATRSNAGVFGRALYFDGTDDKVTVPSSSTLDLTSGLTMEAWVKPDATSSWRTVIFKEAGGVSYSLYANSDADYASVHLGLPGGETAVNAPDELDPSAWTHLAATFDGNIIRLFANGVQIGSKAAEGPIGAGAGPLTFGANNIWGEHYKGLIDEIRVYNRPLSAADIKSDMDRAVVAGTPAPPSTTNPETIGRFEKPQTWPIVPVHLSLLSDGKVAAWDGFEAAVNSERRWDPATKQFVSIATGRNLFCAGHITLLDGRLLVAGGHIEAYEGTKDTNLFNPQSGTWARGQDMAQARWYPTVTGLPDGRVFVVSGDNAVLDRANQPVPLTIASNTLPEIYNPTTNTWQSLPQAQRWMPLYPFMFVLPNGKLFDAGPDRTTRTLDLATNTWTAVGGDSLIDGHSAVMYRPGKILKSGTWSEPEFPGRGVTNRAVAIDFNQSTPQWQEVAPMAYKRSYHTLTVLPDGKVLATGGQTGTDGVDQTTGVLASEIWDPDTNTWTTTASSWRPRLYHSSALLLPSGQVLLAGGGAYGNAKNENNAELYSPPYLFKGPRPQVTAAPDRVHYNAAFSVDTPDASRITKVNLVRMGSVTHNLDMDQRLIPLNMTKQADSVTITGPQNANVAPPGYYMVFLVDNNGVPSEGQIVRIDAEGDTVPPSVPTAFGATAQPASVGLAWAASSDNVGVKEYRVYRSTTSGFTPSTANRIARVTSGTSYVDEGRPSGTYYYRVEAVDAAGNRSGASAQASATVTGDTAAPTVSMTAPAGGASLSATVPVTATAADAVGVKSVQFKLDGNDLGAADTTSPYSINWNTTETADGPHTLTAVAKDGTGNATTSAPVAVRVSNTGLVAAYGFEETSGTTAKDSVNTNDGTISGATRVTDGRFGRALAFNGVSNTVAIPHAPALNLAAGMTLEAWVKPAGLGSWRSVILKEQTGSLAYGLFASTDANVPSGRVFTTAEQAANAPATLPLSTWAHLSMTWNGTTLNVYVDGALVGTQPATGPLVTGTGQLKIGGDNLRSEWFNGLIDEVRVYNRALSAGELQADMNRAVKP